MSKMEIAEEPETLLHHIFEVCGKKFHDIQNE